jgi:hypothetical protein
MIGVLSSNQKVLESIYMEKIEEICFLLEEVISNYVAPEHKDAGEISDLRRLLDQYYQSRKEGNLKEARELRGKLIDARNHWKTRHPELDHVGTSDKGQYRMKRRIN